MKSFAEIIDGFGVGTLAQILNVEESHVRTMKARNSIPPEYWGILLDEAPAHGIKSLDYKTFRNLRKALFAKSRGPQAESAHG